MNSNESTDSSKMQRGVDQLLGKVPWEARPAEPPCSHEDDGFKYGTTAKAIILKCAKCGVHYDQPINP